MKRKVNEKKKNFIFVVENSRKGRLELTLVIFSNEEQVVKVFLFFLGFAKYKYGYIEYTLAQMMSNLTG